MALEVRYASEITVIVENQSPFVGADDSATFDGLNTHLTAVASSATPVTKLVAFQQALSGGAATIDLTAMTGVFGEVVDGTGLKVQFAKFRNPVTNANSITIVKGASNGFTGFGAAFSVVLPPGAEWTMASMETGADIASGVKTLDLSGTASQALDVFIVMG